MNLYFKSNLRINGSPVRSVHSLPGGVRRMKFLFHQLLILACLASPMVRAGVIPVGYSLDRYSSLWKRSPFTIASVQQEVVPAGFASKFALVGLAKIGSEDVVTLLDKESQERIILSSQEGAQDLKLILVERDADPLKTSVTIQKGGETGRVKFDPSLLAAANPPSPAAPASAGAQVTPVQPSPQLLRVRRSLPIPSPYQAQPPAPVTNPTTASPPATTP